MVDILKKIAALSLSLIFMLQLASCTDKEHIGNTDSTEPSSSQSTTVSPLGTGTLALYFSLSDSLNPYEAETKGNQQLSTLIFEGLFRLDQNLNPQPALAQGIEINGLSVVVRLKNINYSDGSAVSAEDVTYSYSLAKASKYGSYASQLANIKSAICADGSTVVFTLSHADINVAAILDFPILKRGTLSLENEDGKSLPPIGAGRYTYNDDSGIYTLTGNPNYYGGMPQNTVYLVNTPDSEALKYYLRSQDVDIYCDDSEFSENTMVNSRSVRFRTSNFVYIGINSYSGLLKKREIRQALQNAASSSEIAEKCYYGYAEAASSLYGLYNTLSTDMFSTEQNLQKTVELLALCGYNSTDSDGYRINADGSRVKLKILYNSDNSEQTETALLLVKQMKACGIELVADAKKASAYASAVKSGSYELYVGEMRLGRNFDYTSLMNSYSVTEGSLETTSPITASTAASTTADGTPAATTVAPTTEKTIGIAEEYANYMSRKITLDEFGGLFSESVPFIPLLFRLGTVSFNESVTPDAAASAGDAYYNIEYLSTKK